MTAQQRAIIRARVTLQTYKPDIRDFEQRRETRERD